MTNFHKPMIHLDAAETGSLILTEKESYRVEAVDFRHSTDKKQDNHGSYSRLQGWGGNQGSDLNWWGINYVVHHHQLSL